MFPLLDADVIVVGAGIIGLATARALHAAQPARTVLVIEAEATEAIHQSGRNSGVIHAGIYNGPRTQKAALCARGRALMLEFCQTAGIPTAATGKVVVATTVGEVQRLHELRARATANAVPTHLLSRHELADLEPHAAGIAALHVPSSATVDFRAVCAALRRGLTDDGVEVRFACPARGFASADDHVEVATATGTLRARGAVNCTGLHSDELAQHPDIHIVPFRGEYFELRPESRFLVRSMIYPVADPRLPFLGVHLTRHASGAVHAGPNAVPAFGREAYRWRDVRPRDVAATASFPGARSLARRYWRTGLTELARSSSVDRFAASLARLVPALGRDDLVRSGSGIRAQAVRADGTLVDDFAFSTVGRVVHVVNAPSPGATASLAIGEAIAERVRRVAIS